MSEIPEKYELHIIVIKLDDENSQGGEIMVEQMQLRLNMGFTIAYESNANGYYLARLIREIDEQEFTK